MEESRPMATGTVQIDNERVRVTLWQFAPGEATGHHRHEMDYVVVPLATGRLLITNPNGTESRSELVAGKSYFRHAGVEHNVINDNPKEFAFVEIEMKQQTVDPSQPLASASAKPLSAKESCR